MKKSLALLLILLLVFYGMPGPVQTAGQDARPFKTGLTAPTEREKELFAKTARTAELILPNSEGLARINENRKAKGLPVLSGSFAALESESIVTADSKNLTDQKYAAILENYQSLLDSLPSQVDLSTSTYFPAIGDQGQLGSCASFASTYYAATYQTAARRGIDLTANPDRVLSPRFTYNLNNDGEDQGSSLYGNLLTLYTRGAPFADEISMQNYQYDGYDFVSPGVIDPLQYREYPQTAAIYNDALKNRLYDFGLLMDAGTADGLDQICQMLNNGYVLLLATDYFYDWQFDKPVANDPATIADDDYAGQRASYGMVVPNPDNVSGHAMTVVGYNKDIWVDIDGDGAVDSFEKGALKVANSWGADWMNDGFVWLSFNALQDANGHLGVVTDDALIYLVAQDTYTPQATAEITVNTARRNELWLFGGVNWSEAGEPVFAYSDYVFSGHWGGPYSFAGTGSASTATVVIDLSDAIAGEGFTGAGGKLSLFAGVGDDMSGSLVQRVDSIVYKAAETVIPLESLPVTVNYTLSWFTGKALISAADPPAYDPGVEALPVMPGNSPQGTWSSGPDEVAEWQFTPGKSGYYTFSHSLGAQGALEILNDARQLLYMDAETGGLTVPLYAGKTYCLRVWYAGPGEGASFTASLLADNLWQPSGLSAQLSSLSLSGSEPLSPAFTSDIYGYSAQVAAGFSVQATPSDAAAYVVTGGKVGLSHDVLLEENSTALSRIVVTARDWLQTRVYKVQATRGTCSAEAGLAALTVSSGTWDQPFTAAITRYHVTLPEADGTVTVTAASVDTRAAVYINGIRQDSLTLDVLPGGNRTVSVRVLAEDLVSSRTYTVELARPGCFDPGAYTIDLSSWTPAETIAAPTGSLLFLTDAVGKRIQVADLNAGTLMTAGMPYKPHSLTWGDGVLLAALSTPEVEADLLAVLDPASGRIIKIIPVNTEIGHLATDGVHAFVCGSARMQSYDLSSGSRLSESYTSSVYDMQYNPTIGMLYTTGYNSSNAYRVIDGALSYLDSSTERANSITVMPDGRQLLLDNGVVLTCSDQAETNLEYVTRIQGGSLVKADPANNEVYVVSERLVNVYAGEDLAFRRVVPQPRETEMLFVSDSRLIIAEEEAGSLLVFRQSGSRTMLQSVKIDGDYCSELYPLQQTIAGPELPYAVSSVLVSAEAAFPGSTLSGDIGSVPLAVGENNLTISVSDPLSGDSRTYTLTVTRLDSDPLPPAVDARSNLGFTPLDIALDPERPVAYLTAPSSRILYRVNLETGEIQTKTFFLPAERLVVKNGKIYLTLLRSGHQYWDNTYLNGYGAVAAIDTATFRTEFIFNTNIDPYDITADEAGHVFLAPGSNQHSILAAYASQSGQFCSSIGSVYFKSWLDRNPISGKLYTISTNLIPRDIDAFEVSDGLITVNYDSPYHGNYEMYTLMRVS